MIAHLVLFRPRHELPGDQRESLAAALSDALQQIPQVRRARIGRRVGDRSYGQKEIDWPFAAVLEFDTELDLQGYLGHPAHAELATRFFDSLEASLICDFELFESSRAREWLR